MTSTDSGTSTNSTPNSTPNSAPSNGTGPLAGHAESFARLALTNVTREYPNQPGHLLAGPAELTEPRTYHPAFYGAYDWHSSVHMHWLLVRLTHRHGNLIDQDAVTRTLDAHLSPAALSAESGYLRANPSFERPYGWAWLLMLAAESGATDGQRWGTALAPAARAVAELVLSWLAKATYPVRHGTHTNSAFALGLILDSAERAGVPELTGPVAAKLREWFLDDHGAATRWEPSGQDFLSPSLSEADAMRRVLTPEDFAGWLAAFLPELSAAPASGSGSQLLFPPVISDPADPQIGHLYGLCLSRSAALYGIAGALPDDDPRVPLLRSTADKHLAAGLPVTSSGDFSTDHWLATFAALALEAAASG